MTTESTITDPSSPRRGSRAAILIALILALLGFAIQAFALKMAYDIDLSPTPQASGNELADLAILVVVVVMLGGVPFTFVGLIIALVGACRRTDLRAAYGGVLAMVFAVQIGVVVMMFLAARDAHRQGAALDADSSKTPAGARP